MPARDFSLRQVTSRLERSSSAQQNPGERPALYGGKDTIKRLGDAGGSPARRRIGRSGLAIGQSVNGRDGILGSDEDAVKRQELEQAIEQVLNLLADTRNRRGILVFTGDPNDEENGGADPAFQEYDRQLLYTGSDTASGALYYYEPSDGVTDGQWLGVMTQEEINWTIPEPIAQTYTVVYQATYAFEILSFTAQAGTTATLNVANGDTVAVGTDLTVTVSVTDGNPWAFTIATLRI